jgi:hypothetical protein
MGKFLKKLNKLKEGTNTVGNLIDSKVQKKYNSKYNPNKQRYNINKKTDSDFSGEDEFDDEKNYQEDKCIKSK